MWLAEFRYRSENAYPLIDRWIERGAERYWEE